jgi:glycosyltransferase involved in cell wall biosynthesis
LTHNEDGVTALTVEPSNPADLKAKMQTIINADYEQIGEAAHTFIEMRFDSKALNEKILERKRMLVGN